MVRDDTDPSILINGADAGQSNWRQAGSAGGAATGLASAVSLDLAPQILERIAFGDAKPKCTRDLAPPDTAGCLINECPYLGFAWHFARAFGWHG